MPRLPTAPARHRADSALPGRLPRCLRPLPRTRAPGRGMPTRESACFTMVFTAMKVMPSGSVTSRCPRLRQSISTAECARPKTEMYWSMMPQGMPTKLRSARWQSLASSSGSNSRPRSSARADATSSAADELSPEPSGTVLRISRFAPSIGSRRAPVPAPRRSGSRSTRARAAELPSCATSNSRSSWRSLRIDAQFAVRRRRGGDVGGQIQRHGKHEAEIVVSVFADQVDPAGRPKHTRLRPRCRTSRGTQRS